MTKQEHAEQMMNEITERLRTVMHMVEDMGTPAHKTRWATIVKRHASMIEQLKMLRSKRGDYSVIYGAMDRLIVDGSALKAELQESRRAP